MSSFNHKVIKHKVGLLNLAEELGNVSKACKLMAFLGTPFIDTKQPRKTAVLKLCSTRIDADRI